MTTSYSRRAGSVASLGLLIPVATTVTYMLTLGGPDRAGYGPGYAGVEGYFTERWSDIVTVWTIESVGFILCAIASFGLAAAQEKGRAAWNAVALGSLGGFVSTAMGISLFQGFGTAGEDHFPLMVAVLNSSFFFFFVGKALTAAGVAGLAVELLKDGNLASKLLALIGGVVGLGALAINTVAAARGLDLVLLGGFSGTVATALGIPIAFLVTRSAATGSEEVA
ncbi:MAG: hypothetical protein AAF225_05680 [Pseudomonadota bacterium]